MKDVQNKIKFHYQTHPFYFPKRSKLKNYLLSQFKKGNKDVEAINYIFCDDGYLLQLNKNYLNHDTLTDILTFEFSQKDKPIVSDIYISIERVKENAVSFRTTFSNELLRVIFHGALHLIGFKDKTPKQEKEMRLKEQEYLDGFAISRGTQSGKKY